MLGFSEGESCFFIGVNKSNCTKSGYQVQLKFLISQNLRDAELLKLFIDFFNCGKFYEKSGDIGEFVVVNFSDLTTKIIPFFEKYKFRGVKLENFKDFVLASELMKNKEHLSIAGVEKIKEIKNRMNRGRFRQ